MNDSTTSRPAALVHRVPGSARLLTLGTAGRRARHVRALAGTSDWRRTVLDRAGALAVGVCGPRRWPAADDWSWPQAGPAELVSLLHPLLPGLDLLGAATPRQTGRRRLSLLGRQAGTLVVIKLGVDEVGASLSVEADVLEMLGRDPLPGVATPRLVAGATVSDLDGAAIQVIATTSVSIRRQRPALDVPLRTFEDDLTRRLAALDRPVGTAPDSVPVHGDLTPWNLRRTPHGLALFDWESAGWGRPGSDIGTYRRSCDEVRPFWSRRPDTGGR